LTSTLPTPDVLATVDLGSNTFRLQVSRVVEDQLYPLDAMKETVRLGAGLTADKYLDDVTQEKALACMARFGERLRGFNPRQVRIVGTNTLRVAKNSAEFIQRAEALLGFRLKSLPVGKKRGWCISVLRIPCPPPRRSAWWWILAAAPPSLSSAASSRPM
jgi:exopolyphosphatase/guanosine-5'-triphosphate,3'-diphosphate pyrophosphatase